MDISFRQSDFQDYQRDSTHILDISLTTFEGGMGKTLQIQIQPVKQKISEDGIGFAFDFKDYPLLDEVLKRHGFKFSHYAQRGGVFMKKFFKAVNPLDEYGIDQEDMLSLRVPSPPDAEECMRQISAFIEDLTQTLKDEYSTDMKGSVRDAFTEEYETPNFLTYYIWHKPGKTYD